MVKSKTMRKKSGVKKGVMRGSRSSSVAPMPTNTEERRVNYKYKFVVSLLVLGPDETARAGIEQGTLRATRAPVSATSCFRMETSRSNVISMEHQMTAPKIGFLRARRGSTNQGMNSPYSCSGLPIQPLW